MSSNSIAIEIQNLSYAYRSNWLLKRVPRLFDINLQVREGESFGFLGVNGAGKTTTIKCLLGLLKPRAGKVSIFGRDTSSPEARRSVGYLPEQPYFYDHLTVSELVTFYAVLAGVPSSKLAAQVASSLATVHLADRAKSPMRTLSKGLTQRVALAQAVVAEPKVLILDEPFSGLDPIGRKEFVDILLSLKKQGTTIFMSSHILGDVEFLCDRVSIMAGGKILGVYNLSEMPQQLHGIYELTVRNIPELRAEFEREGFQTDARETFLKLSSTSREQAEKALVIASRFSGAVEHYEFVHGGLEELFIKLVQSSKGG